MIVYRILTTRPTLALLTLTMLAACNQNAGPTPAQLQSRLEASARELARTRASLSAAERRLAALESDRRREAQALANSSVQTARLERQLARAHERLSRAEAVQAAVRRQRDHSIHRNRELGAELAALRARLAAADGEIHRLRARAGPDGQRLAELHHRSTAAARELGELRRYNGHLLRERGNLQAWLEEASTARESGEKALARTRRELARLRAEKDAARAEGDTLRRDLDAAEARLAKLELSRDTLEKEIASLRAEARAAAEAERATKERLEETLARSGTPAGLDGGASEPEPATTASANGLVALRAELHQARRTIAGLRSAKEYLVEKIEACTGAQSAARAASHATRPAQLALPADIMGRAGAPCARQPKAGFVAARWGAPAPGAYPERPAFVRVANAEEDAPQGNRYQRELDAVRKELDAVRRDNEALKRELDASENACTAVREQVQTLTWANEVLVKELDAAYAAAGTGPLPKGVRGIYLLREGESLSRVAKAFYGDSSRWLDIVEANKEKIPDPDKVKAGTVILIPE